MGGFHRYEGIMDQDFNRESITKFLNRYYSEMVSYRQLNGISKNRKILKYLLLKYTVFRGIYAKKKADQFMAFFPQNVCEQIKNEMEKEIEEHKKEFKEALNLLDEGSKAIYIDMIKMRLSGDFRYGIKHFSDRAQYFSKRIEWTDRINVVDCGAYIGDTFCAFFDHGIIPQNYYMYELEDNNYKQLLQNVKIKEKYGVNVKIRKKGCYSKNGVLYFLADGDSSKLVDYETPDSIDVVRLDDDVDIKPDYIKMDIEGAETEALIGCEKILKEYSPTLAICIYHSAQDFWRIPLLIREIAPQYKRYWIEHYSPAYNETVLYVSL